MRRPLGLAAALAAAVLGAPAAAQAATSAYVVVLHDGATPAAATTARLERAQRFHAAHRYAAALPGFAARLTPGQADAVRRDPAVAYLAPDITLRATGTVPLAAGEGVQPGIRRIGAAAGSLVQAAASPAVAVLDSGIDLANPDLDAVSGTNCVKPGMPAADDNGHGTHVAGIVAARNQGAGLVGAVPGTRLIAVKVLNARRTGTLSQFLCGIDWVARNAAALGIRVANMSISGAGADDGACGSRSGDPQHQAICAATSAGVTFVVSAGNAGTDFARTVPAAYSEVLTATAMTDTDGRAGGLGAAPRCTKGQGDDKAATSSNFAVSAEDAAHVVAAPGTCVVSAKPGGGTATYNGTSQAAPHVAAVVAACLGGAGVPGPCAGLAPAQVIERVREDALAAAGSHGFAGDPLRPVSGRVYGPLVEVAS